MIRALEILEEMLWGKPDDELDLPLMEIPGLGPFTVRDAFQNVGFVGSIGSGKTTSAKTYYRALLLEQFGGLVLSVKETQIEEIVSLARDCGRERDVIILGVQQGHRFNPLDGASVITATELLVDLSDVISGRSRGEGDNAGFWRATCKIMVERLVVLCRAIHGRIEVRDLAKMFAGRADSLNQLADPVWRQTSVMASALDVARGRPEEELQRAVEYFGHDFPTHGGDLRGSIAATVSVVLESLRTGAMLKLFSGQSTFTMRDLFSGGKICVVGLPGEGSEADGISKSEGRIANVLMQFCFCRAVTQAKRHQNVFLISDECQETISQELQEKLSLMRESRVAVVLLTQDLAALDTRMGRDIREGILGKCATRVFLRQVQGATKEWAAKEIGKFREQRLTESRTWGTGGPKHGESTQPAEEWRVRPEVFGKLENGGPENKFIVETIVQKDGTWARVKWHQMKPGRSGTVRIA
jgi:type IV secretory pathway TraG/TraD family ATPase VirD4